MELSESEAQLFAREREDYTRLVHTIRTAHADVRGGESQLICLGHAGGADNQAHGRASGGFVLRSGLRTVVVDPGSNALACAIASGLDPYTVTDILASHAHADHVGDLTAAVAAALHLGFEPTPRVNVVVCPTLADHGNPAAAGYGFTLPRFAWSAHVTALYWADTEVIGPDGSLTPSRRSCSLASGWQVTATQARHGTIGVSGFVIDAPCGRIGYTADTCWFEELAAPFEGCDVLWMNLNTLGLSGRNDVGPARAGGPVPVADHLGYAGVCELITAVQPRVAVVSHLGAQLLAHRGEIEASLRNRFQGMAIEIHCPRSGQHIPIAVNASTGNA